MEQYYTLIDHLGMDLILTGGKLSGTTEMNLQLAGCPLPFKVTVVASHQSKQQLQVSVLLELKFKEASLYVYLHYDSVTGILHRLELDGYQLNFDIQFKSYFIEAFDNYLDERALLDRGILSEYTKHKEAINWVRLC